MELLSYNVLFTSAKVYVCLYGLYTLNLYPNDGWIHLKIFRILPNYLLAALMFSIEAGFCWLHYQKRWHALQPVTYNSALFFLKTLPNIFIIFQSPIRVQIPQG